MRLSNTSRAVLLCTGLMFVSLAFPMTFKAGGLLFKIGSQDGRNTWQWHVMASLSDQDYPLLAGLIGNDWTPMEVTRRRIIIPFLNPEGYTGLHGIQLDVSPIEDRSPPESPYSPELERVPYPEIDLRGQSLSEQLINIVLESSTGENMVRGCSSEGITLVSRISMDRFLREFPEFSFFNIFTANVLRQMESIVSSMAEESEGPIIVPAFLRVNTDLRFTPTEDRTEDYSINEESVDEGEYQLQLYSHPSETGRLTQSVPSARVSVTGLSERGLSRNTDWAKLENNRAAMFRYYLYRFLTLRTLGDVWDACEGGFRKMCRYLGKYGTQDALLLTPVVAAKIAEQTLRGSRK